MEAPVSGRAETLETLTQCATAGGYGCIGLLPRSGSWRDRPERLAGLERVEPSQLTIHLWGSFSIDGKGEHLSRHGDLLEHGAIGLADDDAMVPLALLSEACSWRRWSQPQCSWPHAIPIFRPMAWLVKAWKPCVLAGLRSQQQ